MASNKQTIVNYKAFNPSTDCGFSKPKVNKVGGKNVRITNKKSNDVLHLSTPLMLTWGINEYQDEKTGRVSYDMTLQFPNEEYATPETNRFLEVIQEYEKTLKETVKANCREWLNKPTISDEGMDLIWNPIVRYPKDKETLMPDYNRPPAIRVKVPNWDGRWDFELFDSNGRALFPNSNGQSPLELITKGTKIAVLLQSGGIYFASGKCGSTFRIFQGVVQPRATLKGTCHIQLDASEQQQITTTDENDNTFVKDNTISTSVVDSDDEEESHNGDEHSDNEEQQDEPEPEPEVKPKKVVKKVVRRKAN